MTSASIRDAREEDLRGIAEVHTRSWQVAYRGLIPDEVLDGLEVESRLTALRDYRRQRPEAHLLVARQGEEVMGFVWGGASRDEDADIEVGEVYSIYVDPVRWGEGIGSSLLQAMERRLLEDDFDAATLWVLTENARTRRFYKRHGWTADGFSKRDDRGDFVLDELRYRKRLAAGA